MSPENKVIKSLIVKIARKVIYRFMPESVRYKNVILPARHLRYCGKKFRDNKYFLASAQAEADRLVKHFGLTSNSRLLDIGCGVGRLPIGILSRIGRIQHYRGIDVSKTSIRWCFRQITRLHPTFQFAHINVQNPRYNPDGLVVDIDFRLPFNDQEFDIIYLYSVFSHMTKEDVRTYLEEFQRLLVPSGKIFLTAFVENDVPEVSINPQGYRKRDWKGPLHCVRYDRDFFESLLVENGLVVDYFEYEKETDGQSAYYISKSKKYIP